MSEDVLKHICSFLSYEDQGKLAQVDRLASQVVRSFQELDSLEDVNRQIDTLSTDPFNHDEWRDLFLSLVTSPIIGHPKHWIPLKDRFMRRFIVTTGAVDECLQSHNRIIELLVSCEKNVTSQQVYQFCKFLLDSSILPWAGYLILSKYIDKSEIYKKIIREALKEFLQQKLLSDLRESKETVLLANGREIVIVCLDIDPRKWFYPQGGSLPELIKEMLWDHIQSLRFMHQDFPFLVSMYGRSEVQLPHNFTLALAQTITDAEIFLYHNNTIDATQLRNSLYASDPRYLNDGELEELNQRYPSATTQN